jgi:hypothetical protein
MSMVSLTMAPLIENNDDWETWLYGMAPTAVFLVASLILSPLVTGILGWSDPLKDLIPEAPKEENAPVQAAAVLEEKSNVIGL